MTTLPELRSKEQIIGDLVDGFLARVSTVNDFNRGSVINQFFQAIGQANFKAAASIIAMIDSLSVDRATGEALQRLAADARITINTGTYSTGRVTITDVGFKKISSSIYAGQPSPVAGSLVLYIVDASLFNTNGGQCYVGRGTPNSEGPLTYTTVQQEAGGAYWSVTLDSSSPTTKFHNIGETVVQAQGGKRTIPSQSVVATTSGAGTTPINFSTTSPAVILDGEVTVSEVPVICQVIGPTGNVPKGAIRVATGLGFSAVVYNSQPLISGTAPDNEDDIRTKIKNAEQAKSRGTEQAIKTAALGVTSQDDLKTVQSASVLRKSDSSSTLVFDDGAGYEPVFSGVGLEQILDNAIGGESELQLRSRAVAGARITSISTAPFAIPDNYQLSVQVNGVATTHTFSNADFRVPGVETAFEVASSINGNPNINFSASTFNGGTSVVIYPRDSDQNNLTVLRLSSDDANDYLGFQNTIQYTILLYKNDKLLYQDGVNPTVLTRLKSSWSTSIADGHTLVYSVDGTPPITVTFTKEAFQAFDITATVSSFTSIDTWISVMNSLMPGVVASKLGEQVALSSARGQNNSASIEILGGSLKDEIFTPGIEISAVGRQADFTFNRQTGQIGLKTPAAVGDKFTAGSSFTRANIVTTQIPDGPSGTGNAWFVVDGDAQSIPTGLEGNTTVTFSKTGTKILVEAKTPALEYVGFDDIKQGDWILFWTETSDVAPLTTFQGFWRAESVRRGRITLEDGPGAKVGGSAILPTDRMVVVRSSAPLQKLSFGLSTLSAFADTIETSLEGVTAEILGSTIRISTMSAQPGGQLAVFAADSNGKSLGLSIPTVIDNIPSQRGFVVTNDSELGMPSFSYSSLSSVVSDTQVVDANYLVAGGDKHDFMEMLNNYNTTDLQEIKELHRDNKGRRIFVKDYVGSTITIDPKNFNLTGSSPLRANDRYTLRTPYQFDSGDTSTIIVDGDPATKVFTLPVSRTLVVNSHSTPTTLSFSADDGESSIELKDFSSFGGFDFNSWRAWRKASNILTNGTTYGLNIKSADFGPSGNKIAVGFVYPTSISQDALDLVVDNSEIVSVGIRLPVTNERTPNWDGTSSFTTDVTNSGGKDTVKYTWRAGTQPNFLSGGGGADVNVGDIVIISDSADFLSNNRSIQAKVINNNALDFTIELPAGKATSDNVVSQAAVNSNKILTVTTTTPHLITQGDRIGLWDAELSPFNGAYYATVIDPTNFSVTLGAGVPGGPLLALSHSNNLVTVTTSSAHGLAVGNVVLISNVGSGSYDGLGVVYSVNTPTEFSYGREGSAPSATGGRFDVQSYKQLTSTTITTATKALGIVTVNTATAHGLAVGELVSVASMVLDAWAPATSYSVNDLVDYLGVTYISLASGVDAGLPSLTPARWQVSTLDLNGRYIVRTTPTATSFTYAFPLLTGGAGLTGGTSTEITQSIKLARSLGKNGASLAFGEVSTTSQEVIDYLTQNKSDVLSATNVSPYLATGIINVSTKELGAASGFINGTLTNIATTVSSRLIKVETSVNIPAGSTVTLAIPGFTQYNGSYTVLSAKQISLSVWEQTVQSSIIAATTASSAVVGGTVQGYTAYVSLKDGETSINVTDLQSLINVPQFTIKYAWESAPAIGDEIKLVALTTEHLSAFWNRLVVTGLSSVAEIKNSEYGDQLQIMTNTFGSGGSLEIAGGSSNYVSVAVVGSGSEINGKIGVTSVPYDLRKGLQPGFWTKIEQSIRLNKTIGFGGSTVLSTFADGIQKVSGPGSFQTARSTTHNGTSVFRVEKHGKFVAIIRIAGQALALDTAGVKEGDWVRLRNINASTYQLALSYSTGDRVNTAGKNWVARRNNAVGVSPTPTNTWSPDVLYTTNDTVVYNGKSYISLSAINQGQYPDISADWDLAWETAEWSGGNTGVFQVVRTFGADAFWIENTDAVEEMLTLGVTGNLSFFSYDSIMPGDVLVISGNILGASNAGRYRVLDEADGGSNQFPTATRLYTQALGAVVSNVTLGDSYVQVNVEEKSALRLWKKVFAVGPSSASLATVAFDSPELMNKVSSSNGAFIEVQGKINYDTIPAFGIDAYKKYGGLLKELNRIIYGDPTSPVEYPGWRAAGTNIDIRESVIKRIYISLSIRVRTGLPFSQVREAVKASVAGYVRGLSVGESVALSKVVEAASKVNGVSSVVVTYPEYTSAMDQIQVSGQEKALIVNPTYDVTVSILST